MTRGRRPGSAEFLQQTGHPGFDDIEIDLTLLSPGNAPELQKYQQGLVNRPLVTLLPDTDAVESLEYLFAVHCKACPPPQHFLYFLPLPHGHASFLPTFSVSRRKVEAALRCGSQ